MPGSRLEFRLWLCAMAAAAAIFGSLAFAAELASALESRQLLEPASVFLFLAGMALVGATVLARGLFSHPGGLIIVIGIGALAILVLLFLRTAVLAERTHLIEYSVLGTFVYAALAERQASGRRVPYPALLALLLTTAIGSLDEAVQYLIPGRFFDPQDVIFNFLAAAVAITGCAAIGWAKRRRER